MRNLKTNYTAYTIKNNLKDHIPAVYLEEVKEAFTNKGLDFETDLNNCWIDVTPRGSYKLTHPRTAGKWHSGLSICSWNEYGCHDPHPSKLGSYNESAYRTEKQWITS